MPTGAKKHKIAAEIRVRCDFCRNAEPFKPPAGRETSRTCDRCRSHGWPDQSIGDFQVYLSACQKKRQELALRNPAPRPPSKSPGAGRKKPVRGKPAPGRTRTT